MSTSIAHLSAHGQTRKVELSDPRLAVMPTPTKSWKPVQHNEVLTAIRTSIERQHWTFKRPDEPFEVSLNAEGSRMFGVTEIVVPGITVDEEFGLAIGFRNSHDHSMALRFACGSRVYVCDNMQFSGTIQVRRVHTTGIDAYCTVDAAFHRLPDLAQLASNQFRLLREKGVTFDEGVATLVTAVERKALRLCDLMDARNSFLDAGTEGSQVNHPLTQWAVYQSVTATWKRHDPLLLPAYNDRLNTMFRLN